MSAQKRDPMTVAPANGEGSTTSMTEDRRARSRRTRWWWAVGAAGVGLAVAGVIASVGGNDGSASRSDRAAPAFRLPRLDDPNRVVALADYRGHPVVVNFWASWCVPCQKEMPAFQAVADEFQGKVSFVGVDEQDLRDGALALVAKTGVRYPSAFDAQGQMMRAYALRGLPATAFISAKGDLLDLHTGQLNGPDLRAAIVRFFTP